MAAKTTVKVATTNNAAKDDYFNNLDWMAEDHELAGCLDVLGNDPGSARLIGVSKNLPASTADMVNSGANFIPDSFTGLLKVSIVNGKLEIDATGLNGDLQSLGEGQTTSITFYYTAQMANGAYSTAKVTIDIEGENDAPEFTATSELTGAVTDTPDDDSYDAVTGTVSATDVDANDLGLLSFGLGDGEDGLSDYGAFTIDAAGNWTFTPDDAAVEGLKTTVTETFEIKVSDGHGGFDTATVSIDLNGVNDTASISGDDEGDELTEDSGTYSTGGTLSAADRDVADVGFQAATAGALAGSYGDFTFDEATGEWTYTLRNGDANVQALDSDDEVTDTLTVLSADGTASETITVTIHGADDAPTYTPPPVFTGTGDPNDFDSLGNPLGQTQAGGTGDNTLYGGGGDDVINGNNGNDTIYGGSGNDQLNGNNHVDTLYGGSGNDTVQGSGDPDTITGGYGADTLTGGSGNDTFRYLSNLDTGDTITDFAAGDKINLAAFAPSSFVGLLASAGAVGANEVGYMSNGGVTTIYVDTDGVAGADLEIYLSNGYVPTAVDFTF